MFSFVDIRIYTYIYIHRVIFYNICIYFFYVYVNITMYVYIYLYLCIWHVVTGFYVQLYLYVYLYIWFTIRVILCPSLYCEDALSTYFLKSVFRMNLSFALSILIWSDRVSFRFWCFPLTSPILLITYSIAGFVPSNEFDGFRRMNMQPSKWRTDLVLVWSHPSNMGDVKQFGPQHFTRRLTWNHVSSLPGWR